MNAWILSLVICSAVPQPGGDDCHAEAVEFGLSREQCLLALHHAKEQGGQERLECFNDPSLSGQLRSVAPRKATIPVNTGNQTQIPE
jgi:hypothetical protein